MLKLEGITVRNGPFTLKPLDVAIHCGECHTLLGPSGAGKSTVLELIVGFRAPDSGRILLNGKNLAHVPPERRDIGYLPQQLALFPHLSVKENIVYGIRCRRKPDADDLALVASLTGALGLTDLKDRMPASLSGGERQRVALARALAPSPKLLILDEPFSSLNETLRRELWGLLKSIQKQYNVTTLMVTHDLEEAFFFGEKVHILIGGRLHQSGPRRNVFDRPVTVEAARFLGIQNLFPARVAGHSGQAKILEINSLGLRVSPTDEVTEKLKVGKAQNVMVGIRPEHIDLLCDGQTGPPGDLRLKGEITAVSETIYGHVLSFRPHGTDTVVMVDAGWRGMETFQKKSIEISLPPHRLFCVYLEKS